MASFIFGFCPFMAKEYSAGYSMTDYDILCFGVKLFLLVWVIFVPIVVTNRLEKIIKLLQEKK